jgi:hypothetical protein
MYRTGNPILHVDHTAYTCMLVLTTYIMDVLYLHTHTTGKESNKGKRLFSFRATAGLQQLLALTARRWYCCYYPLRLVLPGSPERSKHEVEKLPRDHPTIP